MAEGRKIEIKKDTSSSAGVGVAELLDTNSEHLGIENDATVFKEDARRKKTGNAAGIFQ